MGTSRALTNLSGTFDQLYTSLPWGDGLSFAGGSSFHTTSQYTGKEYDSETGLYHFPARTYTPVQGRWTAPDPAGLAAVDIANPQTWNRYSYVMNNPVSLTDPWGLCPLCSAQGGDSSTSAGLGGVLSSDCTATIDFGVAAPCSLAFGTGTLSTMFSVNTCGGACGGTYQWVPSSYWSVTTTLLDSEGNQIGDPFYSLGQQTGGLQFTSADASASANNGGILNGIADWFRTAKFLGLGGSLWIAHPTIPVGWSPGANFVSDGKDIHGCLSVLAGGVGAKVPGGSAGLLFGDKSKAFAIIQGWSVTLNLNTPLFGLGGQVISSSAGTLAGPTVGTPGASLQVGYGGPCH